mmetsp:Transcript_67395/g.197059  ORF Transcript_67395/g.197059 Transcript_67395/m.197059 type:complete len:320 (-) Transcript_67395:99-1058(-)
MWLNLELAHNLIIPHLIKVREIRVRQPHGGARRRRAQRDAQRLQQHRAAAAEGVPDDELLALCGGLLQVLQELRPQDAGRRMGCAQLRAHGRKSCALLASASCVHALCGGVEVRIRSPVRHLRGRHAQLALVVLEVHEDPERGGRPMPSLAVEASVVRLLQLLVQVPLPLLLYRCRHCSLNHCRVVQARVCDVHLDLRYDGIWPKNHVVHPVYPSCVILQGGLEGRVEGPAQAQAHRGEQPALQRRAPERRRGRLQGHSAAVARAGALDAQVLQLALQGLLQAHGRVQQQLPRVRRRCHSRSLIWRCATGSSTACNGHG